MPAREWLNAEQWKRDGRGRHWQFGLSTETISDVLRSVAAAADDSFELLACYREQADRKWFSQYTPRPLEQLASDDPWQYFLRSRRLSPVIPAPTPLPGVGWPASFATNGLVLLQHPDHTRKADRSKSSIGIVNRVRNQETGEVREHDRYDDLYALIKRALAKA